MRWGCDCLNVLLLILWALLVWFVDWAGLRSGGVGGGQVRLWGAGGGIVEERLWDGSKQRAMTIGERGG